MRLTSMTVLLLLVTATTGCRTYFMRPLQIDVADSESMGIVFGSLTLVRGMRGYAAYEFNLRPEHGGEAISVAVPIGFVNERRHDASDGKTVRSLFLEVVPPGKYVLEPIATSAHGGWFPLSVNYSWRAQSESKEIEIEPGKAVYIGAHVVIPRFEELPLSDYMHEPHSFMYQKFEDDYGLAMQLYPNFPDAVMAPWVPEKLLDSEAVIMEARRINPFMFE